MISAAALFFLFPISGHASVVIAVQKNSGTIHISKDPEKNWKEGDSVCVIREEKEVACGHITKVKKSYVVASVSGNEDGLKKKTVHGDEGDTYVELVFDSFPVKIGDDVKATEDVGQNQNSDNEFAAREQLDTNVPRVPASVQDDLPIKIPNALPIPEEWSSHVHGLFDHSDDRVPTSNNGFGKDDLLLEAIGEHPKGEVWPLSDLSLGLNYIFPNVHYQQAVSEHFATGIMPMYIGTPAANGSLTGVGGYLTLSYYSTGPFRGSMAQIAAGFFSATSHVNGNNNAYLTPAVMGVVGWRWLMDSGMNFGFGVGAQYLATVQSSSPELGFSGVLPCIALDIGFAF